MRGVAAFIVVLYHLSLVARPFLDTGTTGDAWWWLTQTPLKIFTAGTEAVLVFFVLSGLVVALPALRSGFSWASFYASRAARLYLPVWGALVMAAVLIAAIPRDAASVTPGSWTINANATSTPLGQLLSEASLWRASYDINNVLWSLRWELIFSIALPAFVGIALLVRRHAIAAAVVAGVMTIAGRVIDNDALVYLPVFLIGTLMAVRLADLQRWAARRGPVFWAVVSIGSLVLMTASFLLRFAVPAGSQGSAVVWGFAGVGAAGLIVVALGSPAVRSALSTPVAQWLGTTSFSLYLVHVPVIATITFIVGDELWWLVALVSVPVSLLVGWLFFLLVERPSHRLAQRLGRLFASRREPSPVPIAG